MERLLQAGELVADEVQNQLMLLAIQDVAKIVSDQATATLAAAPAAAGGKPAAKPAGGKPKKDEPKPVQVLLSCAVLCCAFICNSDHAAGGHRAGCTLHVSWLPVDHLCGLLCLQCLPPPYD